MTETLRQKRKRQREIMRHRRATRPDVLEQERIKSRDARIKDAVKFLLKGGAVRAKQRNLPFDLTDDWARARWTGRCELTGIEFRQSFVRQNPFSPSLDRIDPRAGYVQGNCRFILAAVNYLKGSGSDMYMYAIAQALLAGVKR